MARDSMERDQRGQRRAWRKKAALPGRPYAAIYSSLLATQRVAKRSGLAVRVLLWAHASFHPKRELFLSSAHIAKELHARRANVSAALHELRDAELLVLVKAAIAPGRMGGGGRGRAAVFSIPQASGRSPCYDPGDHAYQGKWRIFADDLRQLACDLSDAEARIFAHLVVPTDRHKNGVPLTDDRLMLSGASVAAMLPGMSERTARRALAGLVGRGLLRGLQAASGPMLTGFARAGLAVTGVGSGGHAARPHFRHPDHSKTDGHGNAASNPGYYMVYPKWPANEAAKESTRVVRQWVRPGAAVRRAVGWRLAGQTGYRKSRLPAKRDHGENREAAEMAPMEGVKCGTLAD